MYATATTGQRPTTPRTGRRAPCASRRSLASTSRSITGARPGSRILLNGKGDELMYERHFLVSGGLPFAELKTRSLIDTRALAANDSPDFSKLIREGLPKALPSNASNR